MIHIGNWKVLSGNNQYIDTNNSYNYIMVKIVVIVFLLFPIISYSQKICLTAGLNMPQLTNPNSSPRLVVKADFNNSYAISLSYNEYKKEHFGIGVDIDYVNTIVDLKIANGYSSKSVHYNFGVIHVRAMPGFKFGNDFQFFVHAGPYFGYLINTNDDARGEIRKTDIGVTMTLGIRGHIKGKMGFIIKNNYNYSFGDKYKDAGNLNNLNIMILAGIYFSFGDKMNIGSL